MTLEEDKNHMSDENLQFQRHVWPNQSLNDTRITGSRSKKKKFEIAIFLPDYL